MPSFFQVPYTSYIHIICTWYGIMHDVMGRTSCCLQKFCAWGWWKYETGSYGTPVADIHHPSKSNPAVYDSTQTCSTLRSTSISYEALALQASLKKMVRGPYLTGILEKNARTLFFSETTVPELLCSCIPRLAHVLAMRAERHFQAHLIP